jgi:hypothetical protein
MTEVEWLATDHPYTLLAAVRGWASDRKLRLFGVACCRQVQDVIPAGHYRKLLDVVEGVADGAAGWGLVEVVLKHAGRDGPHGEPASLAVAAVVATTHRTAGRSATDALAACAEVAARGAVSDVRDGRQRDDPVYAAASRAWEAVWERDRNQRFPGYWNAVRNEALEEAERAAREFARERPHLAALVRCVFGNPFRPVAVEPDWRTSTVVALAAGIYADRAFDRLPILADALEDAGCTDTDILGHCRGDGPHARGCWVVDGVLGKS